MTNNLDNIEREAMVLPSDCGRRLDQVAAELFSEFSRSRLQQWIKQGELRVDNQQKVPKHKLNIFRNLNRSCNLSSAITGRTFFCRANVYLRSNTLPCYLH